MPSAKNRHQPVESVHFIEGGQALVSYSAPETVDSGVR